MLFIRILKKGCFHIYLPVLYRYPILLILFNNVLLLSLVVLCSTKDGVRDVHYQPSYTLPKYKF